MVDQIEEQESQSFDLEPMSELFAAGISNS